MLFTIPLNGGLSHRTLITADQLPHTNRPTKHYTKAELKDASVLVNNARVSIDEVFAERASIALVAMN